MINKRKNRTRRSPCQITVHSIHMLVAYYQASTGKPDHYSWLSIDNSSQLWHDDLSVCVMRDSVRYEMTDVMCVVVGDEREWDDDVYVGESGREYGYRSQQLLQRVQRFFFFSSRRRHTRLQGDWSSDVCSSD